ncbi:hypothetical protein M9H77_04492 [Catharanthus roseus]|uniref:Uncharacterized protein n=1 Tax=Catharanthus roseus TaxID=4058 RepID=A0ACC0CEQ1_CATRO|nr:hypothetical protein M9H77_04492 [Catharanthus roseus]
MRVSSAAEKSERIKTRQRSFYAPNLKERDIRTKFRHLVVNTSQILYEHSITNNYTPISLVKTGYRLLGHLPGLPWGQPQFRVPPDSPLGNRPTAELDMMSK